MWGPHGCPGQTASAPLPRIVRAGPCRIVKISPELSSAAHPSHSKKILKCSAETLARAGQLAVEILHGHDGFRPGAIRGRHSRVTATCHRIPLCPQVAPRGVAESSVTKRGAAGRAPPTHTWRGPVLLRDVLVCRHRTARPDMAFRARSGDPGGSLPLGQDQRRPRLRR